MNESDFFNPNRQTFSKPAARLVNWDAEEAIPETQQVEEISNSSIFFYPNRPILVPPDPNNPLDPQPDYINSLEASGLYIAEKKYNGDNCYAYSPTEFWNRHKERHRYTPTPEVLEELNKLPTNAHYNFELMNYRTKAIKNQLIVHCVMAWKGQPMIGKTWGDSRKILEDIIPSTNKHVILSPIYRKGFWNLFQEADGKEIEGIILKNPKGKLVFSTTAPSSKGIEVSWMLKIRKPCKKYQF